MQEFEDLSGNGFEGEYGLFEAIDYTAQDYQEDNLMH